MNAVALNNVLRWHGDKAMKAYDNLRYEKNNGKRVELERAFHRHLHIFDVLREAVP
jgi:hypothetical protein